MSGKERHAATGRRRKPRRRAARVLAGALAVAAAAFAGTAAAQIEPAQGKLLVATPEIGDPSWAETVMLLLHYDENGALGIAINRPTWVTPQQVEPELGDVEGYGTVYRGGPIAPTQMIFLVRDPSLETLEATPILDGVYASGDLQALSQLAPAAGPGRLRLYAGHAEWLAGQLEREIADGRWTVVNGSADRIFSAEPERLWKELSSGGEELLVRRVNPLRR